MRRARDLVASQQTVFPEVDSNRGRPLPTSIVDAVREFYEDDTVSYCTPGMNSKVTVRENRKKTVKQKKLLLLNLEALHRQFLDKNPSLSISRSKFAELRPKNCVFVGAPGTENVCVCEKHQNFTLLCQPLLSSMKSAQLDSTNFSSVDHMLSQILCNPPSPKCYARECSVCSGNVETLKITLKSMLGPENVTFSKWETVLKKTQLVKKTVSKDQFCSDITSALNDLAWHDFFSKIATGGLQEFKNQSGRG